MLSKGKMSIFSRLFGKKTKEMPAIKTEKTEQGEKIEDKYLDDDYLDKLKDRWKNKLKEVLDRKDKKNNDSEYTFPNYVNMYKDLINDKLRKSSETDLCTEFNKIKEEITSEVAEKLSTQQGREEIKRIIDEENLNEDKNINDNEIIEIIVNYIASSEEIKKMQINIIARFDGIRSLQYGNGSAQMATLKKEVSLEDMLRFNLPYKTSEEYGRYLEKEKNILMGLTRKLNEPEITQEEKKEINQMIQTLTGEIKHSEGIRQDKQKIKEFENKINSRNKILFEKDAMRQKEEIRENNDDVYREMKNSILNEIARDAGTKYQESGTYEFPEIENLTEEDINFLLEKFITSVPQQNRETLEGQEPLIKMNIIPFNESKEIGNIVQACMQNPELARIIHRLVEEYNMSSSQKKEEILNRIASKKPLEEKPTKEGKIEEQK